MTEPQKPSNNAGANKGEVWTRVIGAIGGGLILALQGANLNETNSQTHLIQRIDKALEQQLALVKEVDEEGNRIDKALANQDKMIQNQNVALSLLKEEKK